MKKLRTILLVCVLMVLACAPAYAQPFVVENPVFEGEIAHLPLRFVAQKSGYSVEWNSETRETIIKDSKTEIVVRPNDKTATANGKILNLQAIPKIIDDKTYVPIGFFDALATQYITKTQNGVFLFTQRNSADAESMFKTVAELSKIERGMTNPGHEIAKQYVAAKFREYVYNVQFQSFGYDFFDFRIFSTMRMYGENIIATKLPQIANISNDILILGAHYDAISNMPGANDNASGIAVLLELARMMQDLPCDTQIKFVAFDAEELGIIGSKAYAEQMGEDAKRTIGMLNFDMLAGAKQEVPRVYSASGEKNLLSDILNSHYNYTDVKIYGDMIGGSDHMAFEPYKIPNLSFTNKLIPEENHNTQDTIDNISRDMLEYSVEAAFAIIQQITRDISPR